MVTSEKGRDFIKEYEKLSLVSYKPTPNDVWTIGYGHTRDVKQGQWITKEEAEQFFNEDVEEFERVVRKLVKIELKQHEFDAVVSLVFNVGETAFANSKALRHLNKGRYEYFLREAFDGKVGFVYQNKKRLRGLVNRRKDEKEMFLIGDYKRNHV